MIFATPEQIREMQAHDRLQAVNTTNGWVNFVKALDVAGCDALLSILHMDKHMRGVVEGMVRMHRIENHGTNFMGDSPEDLLKLESEVADAAAQVSAKAGHDDGDETADDETSIVPDTVESLTEVDRREDGYEHETWDSEQKHDEEMIRWNLSPSPTNKGRYICNGCGLEYISIGDRSLRHSCHGCEAREAQG